MKDWEEKADSVRKGLAALQETFKLLSAQAVLVHEGKENLLEIERLLNSTLELPECISELSFTLDLLTGLGPGRVGMDQFVSFAIATNHRSLLLLLVDGPIIESILGVAGVLRIKLGGPTRTYCVERTNHANTEYSRGTYANAAGQASQTMGPAEAAKAALMRRLNTPQNELHEPQRPKKGQNAQSENRAPRQDDPRPSRPSGPRGRARSGPRRTDTREGAHQMNPRQMNPRQMNSRRGNKPAANGGCKSTKKPVMDATQCITVAATIGHQKDADSTCKNSDAEVDTPDDSSKSWARRCGDDQE